MTYSGKTALWQGVICFTLKSMEQQNQMPISSSPGSGEGSNPKSRLVGVAVGMFILGLLVGLLVMFAWAQSNPSFLESTQSEDELELELFDPALLESVGPGPVSSPQAQITPESSPVVQVGSSPAPTSSSSCEVTWRGQITNCCGDRPPFQCNQSQCSAEGKSCVDGPCPGDRNCVAEP